MFKRLLGGDTRREPPDNKTLAKWLLGTNIAKVDNWQKGLLAAFLEKIDESQIVEVRASAADLQGNGSDLIKGAVCQFMQGGPERIGFTPKALTDSQLAIAKEFYDDIRLSRYGELFAAGLSVAVIHAMVAWYAGKYDESIAIASHVVNDIEPKAGEAYRVRAFAYISNANLEAAQNDLRKALEVTPDLNGAKEPLAALDRCLNAV